MNNDTRFTVSIGSSQFDPLDRPLEMSSDDNDGNDPEGWIVQFRAPLSLEQIEELRSQHGLNLRVYVPQRAYLERLTPSVAAQLRGNPLVRAVVRFDAELRVAPAVARQIASNDNQFEPIRLNVRLFDDADIASVVRRLAALGADAVRVLDDRTRGGAVTLQFAVSSARVDEVSRLGDVRWIEPVPEFIDDADPVLVTPPSAAIGAVSTGWTSDLHGEDQVIGIIDNGPLDINHCFFRDGKDNRPGPGHRKVVALRNASASPIGGHATFTSGCAAGDELAAPGAAQRRGIAWAARLAVGNKNDIAGVTGASGGPSTMYAELEAASQAGAVIHTNSWHTKTQPTGPAEYDLLAADVDAFTWANEDHLVLGSCGNNGEQQGPPGSAKNAIGVAAASLGPRGPEFGDGAPGPTADGRRKPDLMAGGCDVESAIPSTDCGIGPRDKCASSYATPFAAAAAVLVRQYFLQGRYPTGLPQLADTIGPSGALLKAVLLVSTVRLARVRNYPDDASGWGLIQLQRILSRDAAGSLLVWDVRNADGLTTQQSRSMTIDVADDGIPLTVAFVWTEPPGTPGAARDRVNDLEFQLRSPSGLVLLGNVLQDGISTPGGQPDGVNNVQLALVDHPEIGNWQLTVIAAEVNVGNPGQGFAVAVRARLLPAAPSG